MQPSVQKSCPFYITLSGKFQVVWRVDQATLIRLAITGPPLLGQLGFLSTTKFSSGQLTLWDMTRRLIHTCYHLYLSVHLTWGNLNFEFIELFQHVHLIGLVQYITNMAYDSSNFLVWSNTVFYRYAKFLFHQVAMNMVASLIVTIT